MAPAEGLPRYQALRIGQRAHVERRYSRADIDAWAALAGQAQAPAEVPEPLIAALYSYLLGEHVPGHGTNYLKQRMRFHAAGRAGESLQTSVRITRLRPDKALVNLDTLCTGEGGRVLCRGDALVRFAC
ncbi:hypothetical protein FOZ76_06545 [Verticiella sediminum]|uniref:MaoC-like domain-containing protein n=2 Tax=Verticiella sediminum TaxID=1247510 RepID=A0A556AWU8_9BURK|nr:hypothetical protein FOZ76_06545 [Verticiella sediminum]